MPVVWEEGANHSLRPDSVTPQIQDGFLAVSLLPECLCRMPPGCSCSNSKLSLSNTSQFQ